MPEEASSVSDKFYDYAAIRITDMQAPKTNDPCPPIYYVRPAFWLIKCVRGLAEFGSGASV